MRFPALAIGDGAPKLIESAPARWRAVNAPQPVALLRAGATFEKGVLVERPDDHESGGQDEIAGHAHPQVLTIVRGYG